MEIDYKKIGQRIQRVRKGRNITQAELAYMCGYLSPEQYEREYQQKLCCMAEKLAS